MEATIVEIMINEINNQGTVKRLSFMETFSLKQGINKLGHKGYKSICGEMLRLYQRTCFMPIIVAYLDPVYRQRAL